MSLKTTLIMLVLVLLLGGWVWRDLNRIPAPDRSEGPLIQDFSKDDVIRIKIDRLEPGAQERTTILFEKSDGTWHLRQPTQDLADRKTVDSMLDPPFIAWASRSAPAGLNPEKFGIGPDAPHVTFEHAHGQSMLMLGSKSEFQQGLYVQIEGSARACLMDLDFDRPYLLPIEAYIQLKPKPQPVLQR